ncbi:hypothetical protein N7563_19970 [Leclercia adecarboxylata ATCC 23216 = NBRC 102595]|nr:hypothetical protein [Leclercia adecarboxylata ATCC 23216 = NBRC 102595]
MKFKFILFSVLAGVLIIAICFSIKLGKVSGIYQNISYEERWGSECKSTIVLVDNHPIMKENLVKLWERERERVLSQWEPLDNKCDYILFVNNKTEPPHDSEEIKYWIGDYQLCLKGKIDYCISKDERLFYIGIDKQIYGDRSAGEFGNKKLYISFVD